MTLCKRNTSEGNNKDENECRCPACLSSSRRHTLCACLASVLSLLYKYDEYECRGEEEKEERERGEEEIEIERILCC